MKAATSLLVVTALAGAASATPPTREAARKAADDAAKQIAAEQPDENADVAAREANLEPNGQRSGFVFAGALGFGVMLGGDIGVGRGPAVSLRVGHVATPRTVLTFDLEGTSALHKAATDDKPLTDSVIGLFVGAQRYTAARSSVWVRVAGGLTVYAPDVGKEGGAPKPTGGVGGLVGGGFDLARWGYLVLGLETFALGSVSSDGVKFQLGFCTNLSYY